MPVVTESLVQLIAKQVDEKGLVVWYDPEQAYGEAATELTLPKTTVARYDSSFIKLRHEIDHLLNDGVVLNIAPLHELVPSWKEAKKYWTELIAGKHEWSSIGKQLRQKGLVK